MSILYEMPSAASARPDAGPGQNLNHPARGGKVARFVALIRVLEHDRKISKQQIFKIAGVESGSSFKRIKAQLADAGLPISYDSEDKLYHVPPGASIARYGIDPRTRAQLAQVRAAVSALGGPIADALDDVLGVLEARVEIGDVEGNAVVSSRHPQPVGGKAFYEIVDRALSAVGEHRWLSFTYRRTDGAGGGRRAGGGVGDRRTVAPYAVHTHQGRFYLWGLTEGETEPKLYALDGMSDAAIEDDAFEPDPGLTIDDALRYSFGTMIGDGKPQRVVVRVEPAAAAYVRCRRWPAQVEALDEEDGGVRLTFELTRVEEIVAWVLSFAGAATIVAPAEARTAFRVAAERAAAASAQS